MKGRSTDSRALLVALLMLASTGDSACSSGSGTDMGGGNGNPSVSFDGPWEGTWSVQDPGNPEATTTGPGTLTLLLDQTAANVTGTATFVGHPCLATCTVSCQVDGHELWGWFQAGSVQLAFSGLCPESAYDSGPHHASTLTATYQIQDGPCAGEHGVIQLATVAPEPPTAPEGGSASVGELILVDQADGHVDRVPVFDRR